MIDPLIVSVGMDETIDAKHVTVNLLDNELARRGLSAEIYPHSTEWEVRIRDIKSCHSDAYAPTLLEALITVMNDHWAEYKR